MVYIFEIKDLLLKLGTRCRHCQLAIPWYGILFKNKGINESIIDSID